MRQQRCEIALSLQNGRIPETDCARLSALLSLPGLEAVSVRPYHDDVAVAFPSPYGEKAVPRVCRFVSNWRTKDKIIVQARCRQQNSR